MYDGELSYGKPLHVKASGGAKVTVHMVTHQYFIDWRTLKELLVEEIANGNGARRAIECLSRHSADLGPLP